MPLDHARFSQEGQFGFWHPEFCAENLLVVLADERGTPGDAPGRTIVDRRPARIDEAASEFRVLGFFTEVEHPELGRRFIYPGGAAIYNGSPWRISRRAPLIGEHNEEIFCAELDRNSVV